MMKTISEVHSHKERNQMRAAGERRTQRSQLRLMACVTILRTMVTRVLPLCGSAGWWVCLVCLIPTAAVYALCRLMMRLTNTSTLTDCLRLLLGRWAAWALSILIALALLVEGASSMTALITLFTEGIGAEGTQTMMAVLTAAALLCCLNREGLRRGVFFLRWPLLLTALVEMVNLAFLGRVDSLFPWMGNGESALFSALMAGMSLGWPLLLLLTEEPVVPGQSRLMEPVPPIVLCVAGMFLINLAVPCELLITHPALADSMLLSISFMEPMVKTLGQSLWLLLLFLHIGSSARLSADYALSPTGREWRYLAGMLVIGLASTQLMEIGSLWRALGFVEPWLLLPFALLALAMVPVAVINRYRRKKT